MKVKEIIRDNSIWISNDHYDDVEPLVSIILMLRFPVEGPILRRCLESVLRQSLKQLELIIVDDQVAKGNLDICKEYMIKDPRVNVIQHRNSIGIPAISIYEAYRVCRGAYIAVISANQTLMTNAVSDTYDFMEKHGEKATYGIAYDAESTGRNQTGKGEDPEEVEATLWDRNCIEMGSVFLHRDVLETTGLPDPHLSLVSDYDWDLWLRITNAYELVGTRIPFTYTWEKKKPEDADNAPYPDQWFYRERQQHRDQRKLLPDQYEEIDVCAFSDFNSQHYKDCLLQHLSFYLDKIWYSPEEYSGIQNRVPNPRHRYGLIIWPGGLSASIMNFLRYNGNDITLCYTVSAWHSILVWSDFAVFIRAFPDRDRFRLIQRMGITCYYFVDDNFREIYQQTKDMSLLAAAQATTQENLKQYKAIITSTDALKSYFIDHQLHQKGIVLTAVGRPPLESKTAPHPATIAFMGGPFRESILTDCILPALKELSANYPIRLICPCYPKEEEKIRELGENKVEIVPFHRNGRFEYVLEQYHRIGADILVHCGKNIRNNKYKTKNALLNATTLGVPLLVSDIEPYGDTSDGSEGAYILTDNTPESWKAALKDLIENPGKRQEIVRKAEQYCRKLYSPEVVWKELSEEISTIPAASSFSLLKRYEMLTDWNMTGSGRSRGLGIHPDQLCYSGEIKGHRRYGFTSNSAVIREIGLLFAVFGANKGTVELSIFRGRSAEAIAAVDLDMEEIIPDGYTYLSLPHEIETEPGEKLYIDVFFHYTEKDDNIGVFEDKRRRTFIYKVFNKLHFPLPGTDALVVDCRS